MKTVIYENPLKEYIDALLNIINEEINEQCENIDEKHISKPSVTLSHTKPKVKKIYHMPNVEKILFRNPATIVWFTDGTKSVAICGHDDTYDKETGVAICLCKRMLGNKGYRELMDEWCYKKENFN